MQSKTKELIELENEINKYIDKNGDDLAVPVRAYIIF
jgi:hypothetical protein